MLKLVLSWWKMKILYSLLVVVFHPLSMLHITVMLHVFKYLDLHVTFLFDFKLAVYV